MALLHVNVDHIATIRQARRGIEPDPVTAALMAELAGAHGITVHLREDRRHIQDRDVQILRQVVQTRLNLEMAATEEMFAVALELKPDIVTLVPEKRQEITTEGGLDACGASEVMRRGIQRLVETGIRVSLFIDPELPQIEASAQLGAQDVELHTGAYANARLEQDITHELRRLGHAAERAHQQGLQVNAGHGLNYSNVQAVCRLPYVAELNIGHSIISRATFTGIQIAIKEMLSLMRDA
ncbi:MAG: pyridoxine 5'-phosphate synthase [SAR324 cluster bacterium]|nr:pyridoxine 5'-phosphate synthase [SAR324 cluster bacterium]